MRERVGDQPLSASVRNQRDADEFEPPGAGQRQHLLAGGKRNRQQQHSGDCRGDRHQAQGARATVAQVFHGQQIPCVKHGSDDAERVAEKCRGRERHAGAHQHDHAGERGDEADKEKTAGLLAVQQPGRQRDEDGRQVGEQSRVRDRSELDREMPEEQIAGKCHAGRGQEPTGWTRRSGFFASASEEEVERPQRGHRERDAPERGGGRAGFGDAHENGRHCDAHCAREQSKEREPPGGRARIAARCAGCGSQRWP